MFEFHYQRNMMSKFTQIQPSGSLCLEKYSRSITGIIQNLTYRQTEGNDANDSLIWGKTTECLCCS